MGLGVREVGLQVPVSLRPTRVCKSRSLAHNPTRPIDPLSRVVGSVGPHLRLGFFEYKPQALNPEP